ncbi:MAG: MFS transporter [Myxococcota bacterium]
MKPQEQKAALAAFGMVFMLMAAYFILRPVRDAMASDWTDTELSRLWNLQFFLSLGVVGLYGFAVSRVPFRYLMPAIYGAFALTFLLFYLVTPLLSQRTRVEKGFYLWVTVFSLLNISAFWSFMSDTFTQDQARRLFPFISAGASAGAMMGPTIPLLFSQRLGPDSLMVIASVALLLVIPMAICLGRAKAAAAVASSPERDRRDHSMGGPWWSGFRDTLRNRYLLGMAVFILLYVFVGSFVYFQQKNILAEFTRAERASILGGIDWGVNLLTFVFAFAVTGRMVGRLGMGLTLASVPLVLVVGLGVLAFAPVLTVLLGLQVARRVGNYSVTRPAREMLFTEVSQEERFKAKPVIDVVVYRGGDAVSASLFALLTDGLGLGIAVVSLAGALIAALWAGMGMQLGRQYRSQRMGSSTHPV